MTRRSLLADILTVTPTGYGAWRRCPRLYLDDQLLGVPPSDPGPSTDQGLFVHELLRLIHERGSVHDEGHVHDVLEAHGADDDHYRALVRRHARRCPRDAEREAHEVDVARFHRRPPPMFMATARIDAVWVHDGLLDARDYKTGARFYDRVVDDPRARVQGWVLALVADRQGLRIRLRYEHLAAEIDEDPEPWEPSADDLVVVEEELRAHVAAVRAEERWQGVGERDVCATCRYRSICPDSAAAAEPAWPALTASGPDPVAR